jgi:hypothetical protein
MAHDTNYIRDLLLRIQGGETSFSPISTESAAILGLPAEDALPKEEAEELGHYLDYLEREGLIAIAFRSAAGAVSVKGLTHAGQVFLQASRFAL